MYPPDEVGGVDSPPDGLLTAPLTAF